MALSDFVIGLHILGAKLIDRHIAAALSVAVKPSCTGTPGETLDGCKLQEEVRLQAPALVVAHAIIILHRCQRIGCFVKEVPFVGQDILILVVFSLIVIERQQRGHSQKRPDAVAIDTSHRDATLVGRREGHVLTYLQHVAALAPDQRIVGVQTNGIAVELRIGRCTQCTRLVVLGETEGKARKVTATRNRDGCIVHRRIVDRGFFEPVGTVPASILNQSILLGDVILPNVWLNALNLAGLVDNLHILGGVQRGNTVGVYILPTQIAVE